MTLLRRVEEIEQDSRELHVLIEATRDVLNRHEEQINGTRGLQHALDANTAAVKSLYKAAYWLAGIIVAGAIGFAFSVLQLVH